MGRITLNKRTRQWIWVLAIVFLLLAILANSGILLPLENRIYHWVAGRMTAGRTQFLRTFTRLGDPFSVALICVLFLLIGPLRRRCALSVVAATVSAAGLNWILKHIFMRQRPTILWLIDEHGYSFPSGHSMTNAALYVSLALLIGRQVTNRWVRILAMSFCFGIPLAIGFSRVYLGVHYTGDVMAGWALGTAIALVAYEISKSEWVQKLHCRKT